MENQIRPFSYKKLAIGTVQFGFDYGVANQGGQVESDGIQSILDLAYKNDINTLDTAKAYGESEGSIGKYIKQTETSWNIVTKVVGANNVNNQIQDSIDKLTVKPKAVLAHSAEIYLSNKYQREIQKAKENEFIQYFGVSLYNEEEINAVLESDLKPDIIQIPMNILDTQLYRRGVLGKTFDKGIEIHVRSAFLQGLFYLSATDLEKRFSDVVPQLDNLKIIAGNVGLTLAELSLLWLASLKEVSKIIIGVDNVNQLKTHLETLKKKIDLSVFEDALSIHYENENILNPSLWPTKS
jgi:aryl-alcohol dehydrogenase-like predicted oxidoreductase